MMRFRSVRNCDYDALCQLILSANTIGITSLALDKDAIKVRLNEALQSFNNPDALQHCYYWFVLEDTATHEIIGTASIATKVGHQHHFYSYERIPYKNLCKTINITHQDEKLVLSLKLGTATELCSLFIHPEKRHLGLGAFLSCSRLLFIGSFQNYFAATIIAELRGVSDSNGISPFWDAIGQRFFHISFAAADTLTTTTDKKFIAQLMPKHPIYVCMLPQEARNVIAQPHPNSMPAMKILLKEGFNISEFIDIFDAGPILKAKKKAIYTIQNMKKMPFIVKDYIVNAQKAWVANSSFDNFCVVKSDVQIDNVNNKIIIPPKTAEAINAKKEDKLSYIYGT